MAEKVFPHSALSLGTAFCLIISYTVVVFDLSPIIGAFLAGTILTSSFAHRQVLESVEPMKNLFGSIFFASIGLSIDPLSIFPVFPIALFLALVAIFSKAIPASAFMFWRGEGLREALILGTATGPRGEVLLIIAQTAVVAQIADSQFLSLATAIVVLTAIFTPLIIKIIMRRMKVERQRH
jgi:CPA2 family monovalent cation:H+ antiporter-2